MNVEVCAPVNGMPPYTNTPAPPNLALSLDERRIIPTTMVPPDENTPIIRMNRKSGTRQKNIASFISHPVHMITTVPSPLRGSNATMP
ncbi:hypothetical protein TNCV_4557751 [Trichonephila clavipes]|nr:hypothetical protein TNCV_4557751 [Trichonephila clavipes]